MDLSGLAVLVRAPSLKEAPSVERHRKRMSRAHRSEALSAFARAMSITSLYVRSFIDKDSVFPFSSRNCRTFETSHRPAYLGWGGRKWKMPFINLEMRGCFPNWTPSTGIWVTDILDL